MQDLSTIAELSILVAAGVLAAFICVKLGLPTILGYLLAGVVVGAVGLYNTQSDFVASVAQLGAALLLFTIGLEFSFNTVKQVFKISVVGAILQGVLSVFIGIMLLPLLGYGEFQALFLAVITSMSSTAFVLKMLESKAQTQTHAGQLMLAWLVTQDILIIVWFILLTTFAPNAGASVDIFSAILRTILLIGVTFGAGKYVLPLLLSKVAVNKSEELLLASAVAVIILFAVFANALGVSFTIGAFLAGLALSDSFVHYELFAEIKPIRDLLMLVFFVSIGALVDLPLVLANFGHLLFILAVLIPLKSIIIVIITTWFGVHLKNSLKVGLGMSQISEFAFLAAQIALGAGWLGNDRALYSVIVAATVVSMAATPFIYGRADLIYHILDRFLSNVTPNLHRTLFLGGDAEMDGALPWENHIVLCGFGRVGSYVLDALKAANVPFIGIELDENLARTKKAELAGTSGVILYGDATNPEVLAKAGLHSAAVLVIALPESADATQIIRAAVAANPEIKIVARVHHGLKQAIDLGANVVEPEFEAALQIINKTYKILKQQEAGKRITKQIRLQLER